MYHHKSLLSTHLFCLERIQSCGGLVQEQQAGATDELAADGQALALATTEAAHLGVAHTCVA
jgi:hypothetical protein